MPAQGAFYLLVYTMHGLMSLPSLSHYFAMLLCKAFACVSAWLPDGALTWVPDGQWCSQELSLTSLQGRQKRLCVLSAIKFCMLRNRLLH